MIGWENNQGAYFITKLKEGLLELASKVDGIIDDIGKVSTLTTTAKTVVGAINELKTSITSLGTRNQNSFSTPTGSTFISSTSLKADKVGNMVHLHGTISLKSVTQPSTITPYTVLTIPSGYRPKYALSSIPVSLSVALSGIASPNISINTSGSILIQSNYFNQTRVVVIDTTYVLA